MTTPVLHIIQIDDSEADTLLVEDILAATPAPPHVLTFHSGQEALDHLKQLPRHGQPWPDLILLDINMPGLGGHEVLALLKATPQWRDIPVVMRSVSGTALDVQRSLDRSAADHLVKPPDLTGTEAQLTALCDHWTAALATSRWYPSISPEVAHRMQVLHHAYLYDHGQMDFRTPQRVELQRCFTRIPGLRERVWAAWQVERQRAGIAYLSALAWFDRAFPVDGPIEA